MAGEDEAPKFKDFDARMRRLRGEAGLSRDEPEPGAESRPSIGGTGVQVGIEMVAGVFGGALIGYGLDRWLDTWPSCCVVMFFLGAAAGMLNAYRHIRRLSNVPEERSSDR
jgi:ATP synthase protein I